MENPNILLEIADNRIEKVSKEVIESEEYKKFNSQIDTMEQKIKDAYPQEVWDIFLELDSLISAANCVEIKTAYIQGLRDGLNLMSAAKETKPCIDF